MAHRPSDRQTIKRSRQAVARRNSRRNSQQRILRLERLTDRRVLAAITGAVFEDANHSFARDADEINAPSRVVYLDANDNQTLDVGEKLVLAGPDGAFTFSDLQDGDYLVRLFNGTSSQIQTSPIGSNGIADVYEVADGDQWVTTDTLISLAAGNTLTFADSTNLGATNDGSTTITVGDQITKMQRLPDGSLLVIGSDASGETAWRVDPSDQSITPVDLAGPLSAVDPLPQWSELAIDGDGRGFVIEDGIGTVVVRSVEAVDPSTGISVTTAVTTVSADTTVLASATGTRSVFASPVSSTSSGSGLELSLWSNLTGSPITLSPEIIDDVSGMISYDDASGLLVLRTNSGGVSVHDVNGNFAALHTITDPVGPVAIDGERDLLFAISDDAALTVVNLQDGNAIANLPIDFSSVGTLQAIATGPENASLLVMGSLGVGEIRLDQPLGRPITIVGGADVGEVLFGVSLLGANAPPRYESVPAFETDEDTSLVESSPAALTVTLDDENDHYILIQKTNAENGLATVSLLGAMDYTPDVNFQGTDSLTIVLHDGRSVSDEVTLEIVVNPVPDSPEGITITVDPVPEDLTPGQPVGDIEVIDVDGPGHTIDIDDDRFGVQNGEIIFVGGVLDFETEPLIPLTITATDSQTGEQVEETITLTLQNANDPITGILPTEAFVFENAPGDDVTELTVLDQDIEHEQFHTFTVDDSRFIVEEETLRLAPGIALDYETEAEIIVNVTATEVGGGHSFTQAITIAVRDLPEQPAGMALTPAAVTELIAGDEVGDMTLDGATPDSRFQFTVDDARFEVTGATLKLLSDQSVLRSEAEQIVIEVTAVDSLGEFASVVETFVIDVLENETPAHNHNNPFDVNHQGDVTALDALAIINYLNIFGPSPVNTTEVGLCFDVNADGFVTALDALLIVNQLNVVESSTGVSGEESGDGESEGGPEGEALPGPLAPPFLSPAPHQIGPHWAESHRAGSLRLAEDQPGTLQDRHPLPSLSSGQNPGRHDALLRQIAKYIDPPLSDATLMDLEETIRLLSQAQRVKG